MSEGFQAKNRKVYIKLAGNSRKKLETQGGKTQNSSKKLKTQGQNSRFRQNQKRGLPKIGRIKKGW